MRKLLFIFLFFPSIAFANFPNTSVLDTATRANEGPPPSANWTLCPWTSFVGLKISSNTIVQNTFAGNDGCAYWNPGQFGPDSEVYTTVNNFTGTDAYLVLGARISTSGNGYKMDWQAPNTWRIFSMTAGVRTQLGSNFTQTITAGDSIGFRVMGTTQSIWYKPSGGAWTMVGSTTDTTYTSSGYLMLEMWQSSTVAGYTNLGGGTVPSSGNMLQMFAI